MYGVEVVLSGAVQSQMTMTDSNTQMLVYQYCTELQDNAMYCCLLYTYQADTMNCWLYNCNIDFDQVMNLILYKHININQQHV